MVPSTFLFLSLTAAIGAEPSAEQLAKARADLASREVEVRRTTIKALIHSELSAQLLAEMQACLKDADDEVRATAATAIGNLGAPAERAIGALVAQMQKDTFKEARETAARALGRIGKAVPTDRSAVKPLTKCAASDADPVTRTVALGALAMMAEDVPGQIAALRKFLHHDDASVRMKASHALGMIGLPAKVASTEIAEVLEKETDGHRRGYVARALGNVGDPKALLVLEKALKAESDEGAKGEMRGAIQKLGGKP
ncbi:MAG TPA: HEAT repeat domain-containing protein [Gemmataceae bacterium]|jgi:HEAT repeat protein|nr:HEAT repeat domain-containing protein [Gemmataceae bacterium]